MAEDQEQTAIRTLLQENQRLKKRLFDLEEKIRKGAPASESPSGSGQGSSVLKLIEHKDFQLEQARARLEEKKDQLEEAAREVEGLRLFREIFESDPTAMLGVNRDGAVIFCNRAASQLLGEKLKESLQKPVEGVDFRAVDPDTAKRVRQALSSRKPAESSVVVRDRRMLTSVLPIGPEGEPGAALIRIQVGATK